MNTLPTPKKLYQCIGKDGTYELLGHCIGAGTDRGHDTEIYRNIHTGQLHSRLPDDFENRMEHIGERVEYACDERLELRQWRELFDAAMGGVGELWPNPWLGEVATLAYYIRTQRETIKHLRGEPS